MVKLETTEDQNWYSLILEASRLTCVLGSGLGNLTANDSVKISKGKNVVGRKEKGRISPQNSHDMILL